MKSIYIECDDVKIDTIRHDTQIHLIIAYPSLDFIGDLAIENIISYCNNEKLFEAIIDNDDEILHNYLTKSGYIFNKA